MHMIASKSPFVSNFAQIGWVVKDITAAQTFFREAMGIDNFSKAEIIRLEEFESTYYGEPCDGESLVSMAYSGGTFIELIQPLSGSSIFQDYLDKNPAGGVHHVAYSIPVANLDKVISEMANKGLPIITSVNHPIANIVFFDTTKDLGVFTEVMGITEAGEKAVQKMKS
ncbi:VOC family protein [Segetibacter koreensis]|uniref:VOC family protein n=1 Tax=Segetibacter koreensis TaxID=398037 RepID=UPI00037C9EBF|nr:VOC family protein [Segetibacter koreensis]